MELVSELDPVNNFLLNANLMGVDFNDPLNVFFFYKISCKDPLVTKCYIGKTINIKNRMANHKTRSKISELPLYVFIRNNGGFENFKFEILHKCLCNETTSTFIEHSLIKSCDDTFNIKNPYMGEKSDYNKNACKEHYKIKVDCECGWTGSKMNHCKHVKTSKRHRDFCIKKFEKQLECVMMVQDGTKSHTFTYVSK
jgi:hypothetical protein